MFFYGIFHMSLDKNFIMSFNLYFSNYIGFDSQNIEAKIFFFDFFVFLLPFFLFLFLNFFEDLYISQLQTKL